MPGWKLSGQYEEGENGTRHFQGMLTTPQVRFSAVKRVYPRAHIEVARNKKALQAYTSKEDTRVGAFASTGVPTIFEYQRVISQDWNEQEYQARVAVYPRHGLDDVAMIYLDELVAHRISEGAVGLEFIAINPMWRSSWKRFYRSIIERNARPPQSQVQSSVASSPPADFPPSPVVDEV